MIKARGVIEDLMRMISSKKAQNEILDDIINQLEALSYLGTMENVLKARNNYILSQSNILAQIKEGAWKDGREAFEEKIRGECGYYLNKYGTPEKQVVYYEKNNQYEQAYKIVLFKGVSQNFFAERVVKQAHVKKRLGELREIIQKMDGELTHSLDYLKIIIAFLKKNDIQDELNKFQVSEKLLNFLLFFLFNLLLFFL